VRQKVKLVLFAALTAALTVAGLSLAAGGGSNGTGGSGAKKDRQAHRDFGPPGRGIDADVADVLGQIHEAVEQKAPEIAGPIIQKAQDGGDITSAQADQLRALVQAKANGQRPSGDPRALFGDSDVRTVLRDIFQAGAKQAPTIGEPIIQKAVDAKKITTDQADQIRSILKNPPPFGRGPGPGHGPGFGRGGPGGPHVFGNLDQDVAKVLGDIHQAVETREASIAEPIIKKAVDDGKITAAQADALRNRRPGAFDKDVAAVVREIHAAVAKQVPDVAEPIIKKAVDGKEITSAQANDIRNKLENLQRFRGGPPPFGGPGGPHRGWRRGYDRPQGNAPGALPGSATPGAQPAVQTSPA
jgi:hypothetical protein